MAYSRTICTRATLYARRLNPSFSFISHHHNDEKKTSETPAQTRSYGAYRGNYSGPGSVIHRNRMLFSGMGMGNGVGGYRFMSSSIGDGVDKSEFLSDVTGVMSDVSGVISEVPAEVIASQVPVMSEVTIAAAESAIPVAALQYLIDGVHYFTGLNCCANLFSRRFDPSFTYVSRYHSDDKKVNGNLTQRRSYGVYTRNYSGPGSVIHRNTRLFSGIGLGNGVGGRRFMSTSIGDGVDKSEFLSNVSGVISDVPAEVIASQAPAMSEVVIAATGSAMPVAALQFLIDGVHYYTGLNWAASIALTTLCIRGATIPFLIGQLKSTQKLSLMRPRLEEIKEEMEAKGDDPNAMQEGKQKMNALFREYGVTPFTPLKGMLIQGPIFISFFLAIRNMAEKVPSFKDGGAFWFTDLSTPDALYIFPVMTAVTFLITVEFNMQEGLENNPIAGTMKKFSRGLAVLTVPFTMSFPKALFCYWVTSNIFSFAYGSVLKLPAVKKALGIPNMPPPPPTNTKPGAQSGFSLFQALKQASASKSSTAIPAASGSSTALPGTDEESKPAINGKTSSSSVLSQRLKSLEREVKQRKKTSKR